VRATGGTFAATAVSERSTGAEVAPFVSVTTSLRVYTPTALGVYVGPEIDADAPLILPDAPESAGAEDGKLTHVHA